jgi:hypothetical protein
MVWALYPETSQRTLEEIDLLFASDSIWNWNAEKNFAKLRDESSFGHATGIKGDIESVSNRKVHVESVNDHKL